MHLATPVIGRMAVFPNLVPGFISYIQEAKDETWVVSTLRAVWKVTFIYSSILTAVASTVHK